MADGVQRRLESMLEELDDALKKRLFSEEEVKTIVKKRTKYEYALRKRPARLYDFLHYIEYELNLEKLRKKRVSKIGLTYKFSSLDYAGPKKLHYLMDRALHRFPGNLYLWQHCIDISKELKSHHRTSLLLMKALRLHPFHVSFWLHAVAWSFEDQGNVLHARQLFQRAVKLNPQSLELWVEWFKMEITQAVKLYKVHNEVDYEVAFLIYQEAPVQDQLDFHEKCLEIAWDSPKFHTQLFPMIQKTLLQKHRFPDLLVLGCFAPLQFIASTDLQFPQLLHTGFKTFQSIPPENIEDHQEAFYRSILTWIAKTFPRCKPNPPLSAYVKHHYQHYVTKALALTTPLTLPFYHTLFEHPSSLYDEALFLRLVNQAHTQHPHDETCVRMLLRYQPKPSSMDLKKYPSVYLTTCIQENKERKQLTLEKAIEQCQKVPPTTELLVSILDALTPSDRKAFQSNFLTHFVTQPALLYVFLSYLTTASEKLVLLEQGAQRHPEYVDGWRRYLSFMLQHEPMKATALYLRAVACFQHNERGKAQLHQVWEALRN